MRRMASNSPPFLAIEQLAPLAEHGQRRHAFGQRDLVLAGEVQIGILAPDIDVNQNEVGLQEWAG